MCSYSSLLAPQELRFDVLQRIAAYSLQIGKGNLLIYRCLIECFRKRSSSGKLDGTGMGCAWRSNLSGQVDISLVDASFVRDVLENGTSLHNVLLTLLLPYPEIS